MRSSLIILLTLAIQVAAPSWAAADHRSTETVDTAGMCDDPPCTRAELQRYEKQIIKRLQRANSLSAEARFRGDKQTADRLHRVFQRNFDRRLEVTKAIAQAPPD
jgi:hypothetical protein